jgi:hypothetical protein
MTKLSLQFLSESESNNFRETIYFPRINKIVIGVPEKLWSQFHHRSPFQCNNQKLVSFLNSLSITFGNACVLIIFG